MEAYVLTLKCVPFQPVLSASVLEYLIRNEKKLPPEYTMAENWTEIQVG